VLVDRHQGLDRGEALGVLHPADQHAARGLQVVDGRALGQELGVGQDLEGGDVENENRRRGEEIRRDYEREPKKLSGM